MPKHTDFYGSSGDQETGAEFKPKGEPVKRDKRGSIEGFGVPASTENLPVEPDRAAGPNPFEPGPAEAIRRTTNEKKQDVENPTVPFEPGA